MFIFYASVRAVCEQMKSTDYGHWSANSTQGRMNLLDITRKTGQAGLGTIDPPHASHREYSNSKSQVWRVLLFQPKVN